MAIALETSSRAARAGLREGEVTVELDGQPVRSVDDLQRPLTGARIGTRSPITLLRRGEKMTLDVIALEGPL